MCAGAAALACMRCLCCCVSAPMSSHGAQGKKFVWSSTLSAWGRNGEGGEGAGQSQGLGYWVRVPKG